MTVQPIRPADYGNPADAAPAVPYGPDPGHVATLAEAEHVLRGMWAIEPDYFAALLVEVKLGRPLNLGAVSKARKAATAAAGTVEADAS